MFSLFKKKTITVENRERLIAVLSRIAEILRSNSALIQADAVDKPLSNLLQNDSQQFLKNLINTDIWGGAGAAWEVGEFNSRQQEIEFQHCFIKLADLMTQAGIINKAAQGVAEIFRRSLLKFRSMDDI